MSRLRSLAAALLLVLACTGCIVSTKTTGVPDGYRLTTEVTCPAGAYYHLRNLQARPLHVLWPDGSRQVLAPGQRVDVYMPANAELGLVLYLRGYQPEVVPPPLCRYPYEGGQR